MIEYENLGKTNQSFFEEFKKSFAATLESGWYILGQNVQNFEKEFSSYLNAKYCVSVASGLDALVLSLRVFEFEKSSEIIVPSNTYIATILAILHNDLTPILVEPDLRSYNIDPAKIEEKITKKTKAIIPVHLYGKPCDMDPIVEIAEKNDLQIIEDCAQAHGATYKKRDVGTFGTFGAFSFYPTKNLGALGDGGAIITNDSAYCEKLRKLRNYGSTAKYVNELVGFNSRLDEIQAGFLSVKLKSLDAINDHKRKLARAYLDHLNDSYAVPVVEPDYFDVYHIFNVRHPKRDELKAYLLRNQIMTDIHYPIPPHKQDALKGVINGSYPISEQIHGTTLSLPISYCHTEEDILEAVQVLNRF